MDENKSRLSLEITSHEEYSQQDAHLCRCVLTCAHMYTHRHTTGIHTPMVMFTFQHSSHLQLGKLLSLVAGVLCIDELGEEELTQLWALRKTYIEKGRQSEGRFMMSACKVESSLYICVTTDLFEDGRVRQSRPKERYIIPRCHRHLEEKAELR